VRQEQLTAPDMLGPAPAIPPGPGPYEFAKCSVSAEGQHLRLLLAVRDRESGRKLHVWQLVPRASSRERLAEALEAMWRRLEEA